jgi:[acyl-carrier-protein] S-malonyltransferase
MMHKDKISEDSKKIALMFPGQGSQYRDMGKDFLEANNYYKKFFKISSEIAGKDLLEVIDSRSRSNLLDNTRFSQISIYTLSCAINDYLFNSISIDKNRIAAVTGHSLGEYSALYSAGAYGFKEGAELVGYRGIVMGDENRSQNGMMAAILGMDKMSVEDTVKNYAGRVFIANYNDYTQIVISGHKDAVEDVAGELKAKGAKKIVTLKVGIASHCPLMEKVSDKLKRFIDDGVEFGNMDMRFFSTTEVSYRDKADIAGTLVGQLVNPIRWVESIEYLLSDGIRMFIEIGPGKVLSGLVGRIARKNGVEVTLLNTNSMDDMESLSEKLKEEGMINEA